MNDKGGKNNVSYPSCQRDQTPPRIRMLSQHGLSLKAGLSGQSINRIERGESRLTHHLRAAAIAQALGCKVEDIFYVDKKQQSA